MSNLIKSFYVTGEKDSMLIDNNARIKEKVEHARINIQNNRKNNSALEESYDEDYSDEDLDNYEGEDDLDAADALLNAEYVDKEDSFEDSEFVSGISAPVVEVEPEVNYQEEAQKIIDDAFAKADEVLNNAKAEAEDIRQNAYDEGYQAGFAEGTSKLEEEKNRISLELEEMKEKARLEMEAEKDQMEPILVDAILKVFKQVTDVLSEDRRDIILQLVNNVLKKVNISRDFIIRVSKEDYAFLHENKNRIYGAVLGEGTIEIVEDVTMVKNQCIIETGSGMYDCSLDVQLENLIDEIKMLSCIDSEG